MRIQADMDISVANSIAYFLFVPLDAKSHGFEFWLISKTTKRLALTIYKNYKTILISNFFHFQNRRA